MEVISKKPVNIVTVKIFLFIILLISFSVLYFPNAKAVWPTIIIVNTFLISGLAYILSNPEKVIPLLAPTLFKPALFIQILMHGGILTYWGHYDHLVYAQIPLIIHQIIFAHVFQFIICNYFKKPYVLGFSLVPLTVSINLFVWFSPQIYFAHYVLLGLAMIAKMFIVRKWDGRIGHIFNPSAFVLCFAIVFIIIFPFSTLIRGPELGVSWLGTPGFDIALFCLSAITLWTPNRYLITMGALGFILGADYISDAVFHIPLFLELARGSVLLGTTFLITDPATSPKTKIGQLLWGITYGFSIALAFTIFTCFKWNTYYDKLFFVCLLNYVAPNFDKFAINLKKKLHFLIYFTFLNRRYVLLPLYALFLWLTYPRFIRETPGPFLLDYYHLKSMVFKK